jgi:hypothetical protein
MVRSIAASVTCSEKLFSQAAAFHRIGLSDGIDSVTGGGCTDVSETGLTSGRSEAPAEVGGRVRQLPLSATPVVPPRIIRAVTISADAIAFFVGAREQIRAPARFRDNRNHCARFSCLSAAAVAIGR